MISAKDMRALALALPDCVELPHFERASFRIGGKIFATLASDNTAMLKLDLETHEALLAADPEAFFSFGGWSRTGATGVRLAHLSRAMFRQLLEQAYQATAAKQRRKRPR